MWMLFYALAGIASIVSLVCYIMVIIAMFKAGDQTTGIVCLVLFCVCGLGQLVALVLGWVNADKWNVRKLMPIWTAAFIGGTVFGAMAGVTAPKDAIIINQPAQP